MVDYDNYSNATYFYATAMALCVSAAVLPLANPVVKTIAKFAGTLILTMYSSPSDIREAARDTRAMSTTVHNAAASIERAVDSIDPDDWEKMSRPDVNAAVKKMTAEAKDSSQIFIELAAAVDQLAKHSWQMCVISMVVAPILAALATASASSWLIPAAAPAVNIATIPPANAALAVLKRIASAGMGVYATAGGIAYMVSAQMGQQATTNMNKAVTPTDPKTMPEFEQVYIPNLPTLGKDGKRLGTKKDA